MMLPFAPDPRARPAWADSPKGAVIREELKARLREIRRTQETLLKQAEASKDPAPTKYLAMAYDEMATILERRITRIQARGKRP